MTYHDPRDNPWSNPRSFGKRPYVDPALLTYRRRARSFAVAFGLVGLWGLALAIGATFIESVPPALPFMVGLIGFGSLAMSLIIVATFDDD